MSACLSLSVAASLHLYISVSLQCVYSLGFFLVTFLHVLLCLCLVFIICNTRYRKPDLSLSYFDWVVASIQVGAALNESRLFYIMCTAN